MESTQSNDSSAAHSVGRDKTNKKNERMDGETRAREKTQVHEDDKTSKSQKKLKPKKAHDPCVMNTLI